MARFRRESDTLGLVSFGVFLIIAALVIINFPDIFSDVVLWFRSWEVGGPNMIPVNLIWPLIWFLAGNGIWSLALSGIRAVTGISRRKIISDAFGGMYLIVASFLFREYAVNLISLTILLPGLVVALGAMILLGAATSYMLHGRL